METEAVTDCVRLVFGAFPASRPGVETLTLWREELGRIDAPGVLACQACRRLVFDRKDKGTPPSLPDVVAAIRQQVAEVNKTEAKQREEKPPTKEEAKTLVKQWMGVAEKLIGTKGRSTPIPTGGHWTVSDFLDLRQRRKEARIPTGRDRWGMIGSPRGDGDAQKQAFRQWVQGLAWTDEQKRVDQSLVAEIDARARARVMR
jgi:hypothetical protein